MSYNLTIPDRAVKYILFQRTEYLNSISIHIPHFLYNGSVVAQAFLFKNRIKRLYGHDMEAEYERIKNYLPSQAATILDIGCGVAGIDAFLNNHYKNSPPDFYLLDKTEIQKKVFYGLKEKAAFYNSLPVAKNLLIENGVRKDRIHIQEVEEDNKINFGRKFDLVVSLISWGFHYPVSTYLDQVYEMLNPGGVLIIDIRTAAGAEDLLRGKFQKVQVIQQGPKHKRLFVTNA